MSQKQSNCCSVSNIIYCDLYSFVLFVIFTLNAYYDIDYPIYIVIYKVC
jgi:hypothetical protein